MGNSSFAWRIPTIVQCILPIIVMSLILFFPETPRWLLAHDRREEAIAIMARYHGDGDPNSPLVQLQLHEITEDFAATHNENKWYDFRELANTKAARYRLAMVIAMAFFGQWSGNNGKTSSLLITQPDVSNASKSGQLLHACNGEECWYYRPKQAASQSVYMHKRRMTHTNLVFTRLVNAINPIFSMIAAIYGATLLDRLGRRKMLMGGLWGGLFAYVLLTAFTATATPDNNLAYGTIVSIYLFGIFFAWGWTPLQTLYAVECLENRTRAKGSGLNFLFLNIAMVVNTYGISVGIEKIGWKLYLVYIAWICIEIALIFFFFVETAGHTLEVSLPRNTKITCETWTNVVPPFTF
jgi:hypothetical protein